MPVMKDFTEKRVSERREQTSVPRGHDVGAAGSELPNFTLDALRSGAMRPTAEQLGHRVDLPEAMRAKMENAFGADLSAVKLYESETVADAGANAVAQGTNIAFAPGMLDFTSFGGQALLGHEISHVVSQARGEVTGGGFLNDRALEARADREGAMAAAGERIAMPAAAMSPVSAAGAAGPMQASKGEEKAAAAKRSYSFGKAHGKKDKAVKKAIAAQQSEQADMIAVMKEQGFSDDEIEAQLLFQRINANDKRAAEYQEAQADMMDAGMGMQSGKEMTGSFAKLGRGVYSKKAAQRKTEQENTFLNDVLTGHEEEARADQMVKDLIYKNEKADRDEAELKRTQELARGAEADKSRGFLAGQRRIGAHHNVNKAAKEYQSSLHDTSRWGYRQKREADIAKGTSQGIIDESAKKEKEALAAETVSLKSENFSGTMRGGGLNTVYKYNEGKGEMEKGGYLKPKTSKYDAQNLLKGIGVKHAASGDIADYDPHLTDREIAFSVLGKLLGSSVTLESRQANVEDSDLKGKKFQKNDTDSAEFKVGKGDTGVLMEEAKGKDWDKYNWDFYGPEAVFSQDEIKTHDDREKIVKALTSKPKGDGKALGRTAVYKPKAGSPVLPDASALMPDDEKEKWLKEQAIIDAMFNGDDQSKGKNVGERLAAMAPGVKMEKKSTKDFGDVALDTRGEKDSYTGETIDAANPDFQRQMNELFLLDTLTGHPDRHGGNFKVNQTDDGKGGKKVDVRAIDNDITFGEDADKFGKWISHYGGLPEQMQIDANMAKNIRGMTKETLETSLGHLLKKEEIDALWDKFGKMNEYIDEMEKRGLLVDEWNDETAKKEVELAEGMKAYSLAREGKKKHSGMTHYQKMMMQLNLSSRGQKTYNWDW